jgi:hypothetical protein
MQARFEDTSECPDDKVALVGASLPDGQGDDHLGRDRDRGPGGRSADGKGYLEARNPSQYESLEINMPPVNIGAMGEIRVFVDAKREAVRSACSPSATKASGCSVGRSVMTEDGPANIADGRDGERRRADELAVMDETNATGVPPAGTSSVRRTARSAAELPRWVAPRSGLRSC